jgi:multiple sugar transport system substrate-binding protein
MSKTKWYIVFSVLLLVGLVVTPIRAAPMSEKVVLKVIDNWGNQTDAKGPPLMSIFQDFMKANPDITIEEEVFTDTEIPTKVETGFLAGEEPDLVFQNYGLGTSTWVEDGVVIPVTDLMEKWGLKDKFKDEAIRQFTDSKGRIGSFPLEGFTWPMWYNTRILKEAGVNSIPKTIDELLDAAKKVRAAGYQPLVVGGADWTGQALFDLIKSSVMTDQEAGAAYVEGGFSKNEKFAKAVDLFVQLRDAKVFADSSEGLEFASMNEMFFSGKAAMMHGGSWSFSECPEATRNDTVVSGFPLPADSPHKKPIYASGYVGKGIWITRNGAQKLDAVEKFVKFFYQPEMIARFVEQAGMTSPLKETPVDASKLNSLFAQTLKWGDSVEAVEVMDLYIPPKAWEDLWKVTKKAFLPGTTAQEILADFDLAWEPYVTE